MIARAGLAAIACAGFFAARAEAAGSALLGGFQPVAVEEGGRGAWICPAAIGYRGASQLMVEGVFLEDGQGEFGELSSFTIAAATAGRAFGWQLETDDRDGVPDWTLILANSAGRPRGPRLGTAVEYRGGEDGNLDGIVSLLLPMGRMLRAAGCVEDVFEKDVDGADVERTWRAGVAARGASGWLSWDWRAPEHERGRHFFGMGIETAWFRASGAVDQDGGYTVQALLSFSERAAGGGFSKPEEGQESRFAMIELGSPVRRTR